MRISAKAPIESNSVPETLKKPGMQGTDILVITEVTFSRVLPVHRLSARSHRLTAICTPDTCLKSSCTRSRSVTFTDSS
jgi:hypothetical protein